MSAQFVLPTIHLAFSKPSPLMSGEVVIVKTEHGEKLHVSCNGELVPIAPPPIDWQRERVEAAKAALQGIVTDYPLRERGAQEAVMWAVKCADALIAELQKEVSK